MTQYNQLSFSDMEIAENRKVTRTEKNLRKIENLLNFAEVIEKFSIIDKTKKGLGGRPRREVLMMTKILFVQYLYNLSDPELEDQLNDRLSFQRFVGLNMNSKVPDYTTIWRFRDALINHNLLDGLFELVINECDTKGLIIKRGTMVDSTIIKSVNRPLSKEKRKDLEENPSSQIDTDATSTKKRNKNYFGYKGHIGVDQGSKLIRKKTFTTASSHDITEMSNLVTGDEESVWGDKAYSKKGDKQKARSSGIYYGVLDKGKRNHPLGDKQKKRNKQKSKVRTAVEHPFLYIKERLGYKVARAKTHVRNEFDFTMNCILYNIFRAEYLLEKIPKGCVG
jgi:IS5 family transposase|tara:strand:+ start:70 stop:1080 length:1011 start_codon:yes stop_codon:yes gene_type:complete